MTATFNLGADRTNQPRSTTVESDTTVVTGIGGSAVISIVNGEYNKNGTGWNGKNSVINDGDSVKVRHTTSPSFNTTVTTTLTIDGVPDDWSTTTEAMDITPDAFDFVDVSGVEPSSVNTSAPIAITGMNALSGGSVTGGQFSVNSSVFTPGLLDVANGDQVRARGTASSSYSTAVNVDVTIGGVMGRYAITTRAPNTYPTAFAFTDVSSATGSTVYTSNAINVSGIEAAANVTFTPSGGTSHEYRINAGAWAAIAPTTINNGDTLQVRLTTPSGSGSSGNLTVDIGGRADTYSVTVSVPDSVPDAFAFVDNANVAVGTVIASNIITISGIDTTSAVSFSTLGGSAHEYRKNGEAWGAVGADTVVNGDTLQVRLTVPGTAAQTGEITMTVGGVSDTFTATAQVPDSTPDAFAFAAQTSADPNTVTTSAPVTVTGINIAAAISVVGGEFSVNGGAWTSSPSTVANGDQVRARLTSAAAFFSTVSAAVTIGGVEGVFSVTTLSPGTDSQYVVTFRDAVYGAGF